MNTARDTLDKATPEEDFQQQIVDLARTMGWLVYHTRDARRSEPGFPDLVMVRGAQLIFLELKTETGIVPDAQEKWIARFGQVKYVHAAVARPHDWPDIEAVLKAKTR